MQRVNFRHRRRIETVLTATLHTATLSTRRRNGAYRRCRIFNHLDAGLILTSIFVECALDAPAELQESKGLRRR